MFVCLSVCLSVSLSLIFYCLICWVYAHMCNSYVCMTLWTHYFLFIFKFSMYPPPAPPSPPLLLTVIKWLPVDDCRPTCLGQNEHMDKPLTLSFVEILSSLTFFWGVTYFHRWICLFLDFTVSSTGQDEQTLFKIAHLKCFHSNANHIVKKEAGLQFWMEHKSTEFRMR